MDLIPVPDRTSIRLSRSAKPKWDPEKPQGYLLEREPLGSGRGVSCATYFLTGGECRFTCSFCDLWKYTLDTPTPAGSLVRQIQSLHRTLESKGERFEWLKLYNAANFFDPYNVPIEDYAAIANACNAASRVVVENHAALSSSDQGLRWIRSFQQMLRPQLEIALGLESIDPEAVRLMNKSLRRSDFEIACDRLRRFGIPLRAFILLQPPGTRSETALDWAIRACQFAFDRGVERCSIIPVRRNGGWLYRLQDRGLWAPPTLSLAETTLHVALKEFSEVGRIVAVDMWDWESLKGGCDQCRMGRYDTIITMNSEQRVVSREPCPVCDVTCNS